MAAPSPSFLQRALEVKRKEEEEEAVEAAEKDWVEAVPVTPQSWPTLSRVEQLTIVWFLAKDKVRKRRVKRKKKLKRRTRRSRTRWRRSGSLRSFLP